jgi:hypothetical protein
MIGRLSAPGARHELRDDSWVSRNVPGKKSCDGFTAKVSCSSRTDTVDKCDGLPLVERGLGQDAIRNEKGSQEYAKKGSKE